MGHFYNDLAAGCDNYYSGASEKFASDVKDMTQTITLLGKHKYVIMNYANTEFHSVKDSVFNIVDSLIDVQRQIHSVEDYFHSQLKFFLKRIDMESWKYQLKYSTKITKYCERQASSVSVFEKKVVDSSENIARKMKSVSTTFAAKYKEDLKAWNCNAMYPEPQPIDLGTPDWLGAATDIALEGFKKYNLLKKLIPGGSIAGAGKVPGTPAKEEELVELMDVDW